MRWRVLCCLPVLLVAACAGLPQRNAVAVGDAANRQIVIAIAQAPTVSAALLGAPELRQQRRRGYRAAPAVERVLQQLAREHALTRVDGWPISSLEVYCEVYEVGPDVAVESLLDRLSRDSRVVIAQRVNLFETLASSYDDTYVDLQTAVVQLDLESAHQLATGRGATVAIIDSSIDARHPELRANVGFTADLVRHTPRPRSGEVHGTAVAGVIAAIANNAEGIVGIAPDVSIAALRACWAVEPGSPRARCSTFSLAKALEVALDLAPDVINMSLTGPHDPLLAQLLARIIERGIAVVTARPGPQDSGDFPASQAGVLVAQSPRSLRNARWPNSIGAPADEILTTVPAAEYAFLSGTSLAAAHVSGVIALLLETAPGIGVSQIAGLLRETSISAAGEESVNACRALAKLAETVGCRPSYEFVSLSD
ncbi:MAG: S8 family serine peptidase [Gammaproteobacteria bacterium]|nr:S8 family serine peptidase [Gammaproteobacteria bacterium]MDH3507839.1 S8 family serine peptidase [Gammaproteobacteria bacterium]